MIHCLAIACLITSVAVAIGAGANADPDNRSNLERGLVTARSASGCAVLRPDPLLTRSAEMANQSTNDYVSFRSAAVPFTDPMPALRTIGYTGKNAKLFSGYGQAEVNAISGLLTQARNEIADCSYTHYGINTALTDDGGTLTALVLAAP